nr:Myc-type, basic helix-loop-helix (bHLH) domain-containing protein [Tanacetum cinerariifolium]
MDDLNEHVPQNDSDLQPYSSTLPETFGYVPQLAENTFYQQHMVQAKDCDIYSGPQWIGEYLPGNGFSNLQGQIPYYGTGIGCSSFTEEPFLSMYYHQAAPRDVNPYPNFLSQQHEEVPVDNFDTTQHGICYQKQGPNTGLDNAVQHQTNMSVWTSGSGTKSGKNMKYRDTDRVRLTSQ